MYQQGTTGFYVTEHRIYDPVTGRWLTVDPSSFRAGDPNLYRFVGNNATNATDPSGLNPKKTLYELLQAATGFEINDDNTFTGTFDCGNGSSVNVVHNKISGNILLGDSSVKFGNGNFNIKGQLPTGGSFTYSNNGFQATDIDIGNGALLSVDNNGDVTGKNLKVPLGLGYILGSGESGLITNFHLNKGKLTWFQVETGGGGVIEYNNQNNTKTITITTKNGAKIYYFINNKQVSFDIPIKNIGKLGFVASDKNLGLTGTITIVEDGPLLKQGQTGITVTGGLFVKGQANLIGKPSVDIIIGGHFSW